MAIDKCTSYDILNPPSLIAQACTAPWIILLPTPKKTQVTKPPTLEETGTPALVGYLLPGPIMATVLDHIEGLAFQETLKIKDAKMKLKYANQFPTWLLDTTNHVPGHMFHHIHLKDPTKVNNGK